MLAETAVDEVAGAFRSTDPATLEHVAHHEAGHAVMHLMYGHYIKSISIIKDHGRFGMVRIQYKYDLPQEADLLCKLAGPVAELFHIDREKISRDTFYDLYDKADLEGVFDAEDGRPRVTSNKYHKHLALCIEVMAEPDFRNAVNLLASRLVEHKYLGRERVIRQKDYELWDIYSTSAARVKHAKKSPKKAISQMIRQGKTLH
jgi:hypothetical protein